MVGAEREGAWGPGGVPVGSRWILMWFCSVRWGLSEFLLGSWGIPMGSRWGPYGSRWGPGGSRCGLKALGGFLVGS